MTEGLSFYVETVGFGLGGGCGGIGRGAFLNLSSRVALVVCTDIEIFRRGDTQGALSLILSDPPFGPEADEAKVRPPDCFHSQT